MKDEFGFLSQTSVGIMAIFAAIRNSGKDRGKVEK